MEQEQKEILDKIEGVLGGSIPTHGEPYFKETKEIGLIVIDAMLTENQSILNMLKVHGDGRNRLPVTHRIAELMDIKQELEKL